MKKVARNTTSTLLTKPSKTNSNLNVIITLIFLSSLNIIFHCTALPFDHIKKSSLTSTSTSSSASTRFGNKHRSGSLTSRESIEGVSFDDNNSMTSVLRQRKIRGGSDNGENDNNTNITSSTSTQPQINESTSTSDNNNDQVHQDQEMKQNPEAKVDNDYKPSKIRSAIFPIYGTEVKKFILMGAIKFFVIMALTLTRDTKDTLVVTQCGAEAIAFLKVRIGKNIFCLSFYKVFLLLHLNIISFSRE